MKNLVLQLVLFILLFNFSFSQISGPQCVDELNVNKSYSVSITGTTYKWFINNGVFSTGTIYTETSSPSVNVKFLNTGTASLTCHVYDYQGSIILLASYGITVTQKIGTLAGSSYITQSGGYTYSIPAVNGATSYTWSLPSGFTGSSNTNSISVNISDQAESGNVTVKVNGVQLCSQTKEKYVKVSECIGTVGQYDPNKITNRVVSGDFDNDGKEDDVAAFYYYGNLVTTLHIWKGNSPTQFIFQGDNGWWTSNNYDGNKIVGVVSGDFDRDGFKDDIAVFYDYGNANTRIHVWRSNGSSFEPMSTVGWFQSNQYNAQKIAGRIVSGDFDRDGFKDDIAAIYDYGNNNIRVHVWQSTGSTFGPMSTVGWYQTGQYDPLKIAGRIVSGDFDRDGYEDDIAAFYDYGGVSTTIHVWQSTGSSFGPMSSVGWYQMSDYNAQKITGRVVSGDFDNDGFNDDIAAFYDYGNANTTIHVFNSTGSSLIGSSVGRWSSNDYNANKLTGRIVAGNFLTDTPNKSDIAGFYDYGSWSITAHLWNSNPINQNLVYQSDNGWWKVCHPTGTNIMEPEHEVEENQFMESLLTSGEVDNNTMVRIYPNPSKDGLFKIDGIQMNSSVEIYDISGKFLKKQDINPDGSLNLSDISKGMYFLMINNGGNIMMMNQKIIIGQ